MKFKMEKLLDDNQPKVIERKVIDLCVREESKTTVIVRV